MHKQLILIDNESKYRRAFILKLFCAFVCLCMNVQAVGKTCIDPFYLDYAKLKIELSELKIYLYKHHKSNILSKQQYNQEYRKICSAARSLKVPCSRIKLSTKPTGASLAGTHIFININEYYKLSYQQLLFTIGHEWGHIFLKHGETQLIAYLKAELMACPNCFNRNKPLDIAIRTAVQQNSVFREQRHVELRWKHELEADSYAICLMIITGHTVNVGEILSDLELNSNSDLLGTSAHPPLEMRKGVILTTLDKLRSRPCKIPERRVNRRFFLEIHPKKTLRN